MKTTIQRPHCPGATFDSDLRLARDDSGRPDNGRGLPGRRVRCRRQSGSCSRGEAASGLGAWPGAGGAPCLVTEASLWPLEMWRPGIPVGSGDRAGT